MEFYYVVRIKGEILDNNDEPRMFNCYERFKSSKKDFFKTREDAFRFFYSNLDVILDRDDTDELSHEKALTLLKARLFNHEDLFIAGVYLYIENHSLFGYYSETEDVEGSEMYKLADFSYSDVCMMLGGLEQEIEFYNEFNIKTPNTSKITFNDIWDECEDGEYSLYEYEILPTKIPFDEYILDESEYFSDEEIEIREKMELPEEYSLWTEDDKLIYNSYKKIKWWATINAIDILDVGDIDKKEEFRNVDFLNKFGYKIEKRRDLEKFGDYKILLNDEIFKSLFILNKEDREKRRKHDLSFNTLEWDDNQINLFLKIYNLDFKNLEIKENVDQNLIYLIEKGESNTIEFKSSLLSSYDNENKKPFQSEIATENIIKAICAFLNTNGGRLFVGISDKGYFTDLKNDKELLKENSYYKKKDIKDAILQEADKLVRKYFSNNIYEIKPSLESIRSKDVLIFTVYPSRNPSFIKKDSKKTKEFYVRMGVSSKLMYDIEEMSNYILSKWGKPNMEK